MTKLFGPKALWGKPTTPEDRARLQNKIQQTPEKTPVAEARGVFPILVAIFLTLYVTFSAFSWLGY
jgi:hypothetical protein